MALTDLLVGVAVLVGLVGIVVPLLPGTVLILGAVLAWAVVAGSPAGWITFGVVTLLLGAGAVVKYVVPSRRLQAVGVPTRTVVAGGLLGIAGFFLVPVIGLLVGFVLGVYLSELQRVGRARARTTSKAAMRAAGLSMLIELAAGLGATVAWLAAAVALS